MNFAKINDISIHFNYINNGVKKPTVVFSNSLGTDFRIWESCVENLSNDYSILTYDKRGHGLSGLGNSPYVIHDHVADLIDLMDHLKISEAVLVGLSVGGLIVQGVYHKRPDLVQGLILCDTAAKIGNEQMWNDRIAIAREGGLEAGVTTGPVTVPLVLAMGLGFGNALGSTDGFGILAAASICPIVAVLTLGIYVQFKIKLEERRVAREGEME